MSDGFGRGGFSLPSFDCSPPTRGGVLSCSSFLWLVLLAVNLPFSLRFCRGLAVSWTSRFRCTILLLSLGLP